MTRGKRYLSGRYAYGRATHLKILTMKFECCVFRVKSHPSNCFASTPIINSAFEKLYYLETIHVSYQLRAREFYVSNQCHNPTTPPPPRPPAP